MKHRNCVVYTDPFYLKSIFIIYMILNGPINMKHRNCVVYTDPFPLKSIFIIHMILSTGKIICFIRYSNRIREWY